jgi:hypothetical protein
MPMGPIALVATLLLCGISIVAVANTARAADDCLTAPNSPTPEGSHWYYRLDQANQRKCWYLRATDQPAQHPAAQRTSDTAAPTATTALEKPATDSASAPTSIKPAHSAAVPLPRVKPQRALVITATTAEPAQKSADKRSPAQSTKPATDSASAPMPTAPNNSTAPPLRGTVQSAPIGDATMDQSVQQSAQNGSAVSLITGAAQPSLSLQMNDQGVAPAPAATPEWPNPPTGVDKTQQPTAPPSADQADAVQPTKDANAPNGVEAAAQATTSTTNTDVEVSLTSTPVAIFPIVALGLVVAGFLLRIVVKILVGRRHRIAVDAHDFDRINNPHTQSSDDQIVDQGEGLANFLHRSSRACASKSGPRRPSPVGGERRLNDARDMAPLGMDKISKRERRLIGVDRYESEWTDDKRHQLKRRNDEQRHESPSIDPRESERINDRHQQGRRDDQHQPGSVGAGDELIDDLQRSLLAAPSNYRPHPLLQDAASNDGGSRAAVSADEIREREEGLEQLRRSLDRLLQS